MPLQSVKNLTQKLKNLRQWSAKDEKTVQKLKIDLKKDCKNILGQKRGHFLEQTRANIWLFSITEVYANAVTMDDFVIMCKY